MSRKTGHYRKPNRRNHKLFLKALFCMIGIVILAVIASSYRNHRLRESKVPYVKVEEVLPIIEAFFEVQNKHIDENSNLDGNTFEVLKEKICQDNTQGEEYLTYDGLLYILKAFPVDDIAVLEDYKNQDWNIGLEDWNHILMQMIEYYGNGEIILQEQMLLGTAYYISDEQRNPLPEGTVLTATGLYENRYWDINRYLFSNINAVFYQNKILTIVGYSDTIGTLKNVYLADISEENIHLFINGYHLTYPIELLEEKEPVLLSEEVSRKIVDVGMKRGVISILREKEEYIHGKLLQVSEEAIEIEGHGIYPIDENMEIYKLYGELASLERKDLRLGYSFTDFVVEDGEIAACLMIKEEDMEYIRVLLKNSDMVGRYHETFQAYCNQDCELIIYENGIEKERRNVLQGESIIISPDDIAVKTERIKIVPSVLSAKTAIESIHRSQGTPFYFGTLEITREEEGLLVINEVLLEDYLCMVVPSEMPSSYPKEALMTQAICARTYAYGKMIKTGLPSLGAHVDDSAGFQVYNNINEQASTTEAVKATHNIIAVYENEPIGAYYYSTSCGAGADTGVWHGSDESPVYLRAQEIGGKVLETSADTSEIMENMQNIAEALKEEENFREWITGVDSSHYESEEGWYRWTYEVKEIDTTHMEDVLKKRYESNPNLILTQNAGGKFESREIETIGKIRDIQITKRIAGGVADELVIIGEEATIKVLSELNIRYILSDGMTKVLRQTGDEVDASVTLPSAFIIIDLEKENDIVTGYKIIGGGFGHGVGMSQNGAKNMAAAGMSCEEIITFFYPGITLKTLQSGE